MFLYFFLQRENNIHSSVSQSTSESKRAYFRFLLALIFLNRITYKSQDYNNYRFKDKTNYDKLYFNHLILKIFQCHHIFCFFHAKPFSVFMNHIWESYEPYLRFKMLYIDNDRVFWSGSFNVNCLQAIMASYWLPCILGKNGRVFFPIAISWF